MFPWPTMLIGQRGRLLSNVSLQLVKMLTAPPEVDNAFKRSLPARKPKGPGLSRAEKRLLVAKKFSAKRQVYENCRMLSQDGTLLCFCDMRKVRWYEVSSSHSEKVLSQALVQTSAQLPHYLASR